VLDVGCVSKRFAAKRARIIRELVAAAKTLSHLLTAKADDDTGVGIIKTGVGHEQ
jgi:hypothetical protein